MEYVQVKYYYVSGTTESELRSSMNKFRPRDPYDGNMPVDALTDWYIAWEWHGYGTENCDLSTVVVIPNIKVILPRWKPPASASDLLINKWETYVQHLATHEKGHVDNVLTHHLDVKAAIQNATCSRAEAEAQKVLDQLHQFDLQYDIETKHGETQGAVFP